MYTVLNKLWEHIYFYFFPDREKTYQKTLLHIFLLACKIVERLQCCLHLSTTIPKIFSSFCAIKLFWTYVMQYSCYWCRLIYLHKIKCSMENVFSKCTKNHSFLWIYSDLLKESIVVFRNLSNIYQEPFCENS